MKHDSGSCVSYPHRCVNYVYTVYPYELELGLSMGLTNSPQFRMSTECKMKRTRTGHLHWHGESTHKQVQGTHAQRARTSTTLAHTLAGMGPRPRPTSFETCKQVQCTRIQVQSTHTKGVIACHFVVKILIRVEIGNGGRKAKVSCYCLGKEVARDA